MESLVRAQLAALHDRHPWGSREIDGDLWRWIETDGPGQRVLLLPGAIGDAAMFVKTLMSLGDRLRLTAVSYPDSSDPHRLADGLAALAQKQGWGPTVVVGSSYGAFWAQHLAKRHPGVVKALLLGNTFAAGGDLFDDADEAVRQMQAASGQEVHDQWLGRVRSGPLGELRTLQELMLTERQNVESLRIRMLGVAGGPPAVPFDAGSMPIITLDCDDDPVIPEHARALLRRAFLNAEHVRFKTGGHYPHVLNSGAYEELILRWAR